MSRPKPHYWKTTAERTGRNIQTDGGRVAVDPQTHRQLKEAIDALERVDWADVPGVSTPTAAAFAAMLRRAATGGDA